MSVLEIKERLHNAIEAIDNNELLEAILTILTTKQKDVQEYELTEEQIQVLKEREERLVKGEGRTITLEEFKEKMNRKYGL